MKIKILPMIRESEPSERPFVALMIAFMVAAGITAGSAALLQCLSQG